jgi:dihydroorotate dehydrogenase, subfamily 2
MIFDLLRPILFRLPPETAHHLAVTVMRHGPQHKMIEHNPRLATKFAGLHLPSPVGLAAGFDKNAEIPGPMLNNGFGFVEVGTITPKPQVGNAKPRVFRLVEDEAVINRLGFNGKGMEYAIMRLANDRRRDGIVGINIGANRDSSDRVGDYRACATRLLPQADYLTINVSSPNTKGLRDLQEGGELKKLVGGVLDERALWQDEQGPYVPVFVKLAPDLDRDDLCQALDVLVASGIDGVFLTNTTVERPNHLRSRQASETGGLSGRPLAPYALKILQWASKHLQGRLPIMSVAAYTR